MKLEEFPFPRFGEQSSLNDMQMIRPLSQVSIENGKIQLESQWNTNQRADRATAMFSCRSIEQTRK